MDYIDIQDKEVKIVLHLLDILQNSRDLTIKEKKIFEALKTSFPDDTDEKSILFAHLKTLRWINAPESIPNNRGGQDYYTIDSSLIHTHIRLTPQGDNNLVKLLPFAEKWLLKKEQSEEMNKLQKQLFETQLESFNFAHITTEETIKIAKSAKHAAWASAIGAIVTALLALIALIINLLNSFKTG